MVERSSGDSQMESLALSKNIFAVPADLLTSTQSSGRSGAMAPPPLKLMGKRGE